MNISRVRPTAKLQCTLYRIVSHAQCVYRMFKWKRILICDFYESGWFLNVSVRYARGIARARAERELQNRFPQTAAASASNSTHRYTILCECYYMEICVESKRSLLFDLLADWLTEVGQYYIHGMFIVSTASVGKYRLNTIDIYTHTVIIYFIVDFVNK